MRDKDAKSYDKPVVRQSDRADVLQPSNLIWLDQILGYRLMDQAIAF